VQPQVGSSTWHRLAEPPPTRLALILRDARTRVHTSRKRLRMRAPQDEDGIAFQPISRCQTAQIFSFPRRVCARVLQLCFTHPESRGGRSADPPKVMHPRAAQCNELAGKSLQSLRIIKKLSTVVQPRALTRNGMKCRSNCGSDRMLVVRSGSRAEVEKKAEG